MTKVVSEVVSTVETVVETVIPVVPAPPVETEIIVEVVASPGFSRLALLLPIVGTLVFLALGLYAYVYLSKKQAAKRPPSVLICGPSGAGKTAMWCALSGTKEEMTPTVTSFKTNTAPDYDGHRYALVDFPGHNKLRQLLWQEINGGAVQGLVFVVDLAGLQRSITETASFLLDLLLLLEGSKLPAKSKRILIVGNKSDVFNAAGLAKMKLILTDELRQQKESRSRSVSDSNVDLLGRVFDFDKLETEVDFADVSVKRGSVKKVKDWLHGL